MFRGMLFSLYWFSINLFLVGNMAIKQFQFLLDSDLFLIDEREKEKTLRFFPYEDKQPSPIYEEKSAITIRDKVGGEGPGLSASQQPFSHEIEKMFQQFYLKKVYYVDLREEHHFFVNGVPVSLTNKDNNPNVGKSLSQIQEEELEVIKELQEAKTIKLYRREKILPNGIKEKIVSFIPKDPIPIETIETEKQVVERLHGTYVRLPITDHTMPSKDQIDDLISLYDHTQKEKNSWVHFHCAAGRGRSSIAVSIFALLKWSKMHSLEEIFSFLESKGNVALLKAAKDGEPIKQRSNPIFWNNFHAFASKR